MNRTRARMVWLASLVAWVQFLALSSSAQNSEDPKPITLHLDNVAPSVVFDELAKQTGIHITPRDSSWLDTGESRISVDIDRQPFWVAAKAVFDKTHINFEPRHDGVRLSRVDSWAWGRCPFIVAGPVVLVAQQVRRTDTLLLARPGASRNDLVIHFRAYVDPRLQVVPLLQELTLDEATDEDGVPLQWPAEQTPKFTPGGTYGGPTWDFRASLTCPAGFSTRLPVVRGTAVFVEDVRSETWTIDNPLDMQPQTRTVDGFAVTIEKVTARGPNYEVKMSAATGKQEPVRTEQFRQNVQDWFRRMRLTNAAGEVMQRGGGGSGGSATRLEFTVDFRTPDDGQPQASGDAAKPAKLELQFPVETRRRTVPFEFKDLPIPQQR